MNCYWSHGLRKARKRDPTARILGIPSGGVVRVGARPKEEM